MVTDKLISTVYLSPSFSGVSAWGSAECNHFSIPTKGKSAVDPPDGSYDLIVFLTDVGTGSDTYTFQGLSCLWEENALPQRPYAGTFDINPNQLPTNQSDYT